MTEESTSNVAVFAGLVFSEAGAPVDVAYIGNEAHYVVVDDGFRRHVAAREVDRQVLLFLREQMEPHKDMVLEETMRMLGKDDLFTKVMLDSSLKNLDQMASQPIPEEARAWLGMLGFRIVINVHGEVVEVTMPGMTGGDWEE
ncbi:MAG: hypothetical protein H6649_00275 [Caldilineae bacterium]|nr:hypothetical protein [Anaerolineae bacterium]MCB0203474.1 hypothetical protein [Anaerolineae bacterium]MCB0253850.1 hypothetical protein [Anaerolineae bacterium]MCB9152477.1 hypothetical protein [Caldilineae bacterium]